MRKRVFRKLLVIAVFFGSTVIGFGETLVASKTIDAEAMSSIQEEESNVELNFVEEDFVEEVEEVEEVIVEEVVKEVHFNNENVLEVSNVTEEQLYRVLDGTKLYDLAPVYVDAEKLYGVNALFIVSLTAQESGWGTSDRAIEDNNLTGFGVYNAGSEGINAQSKRDNILQTASWLKEGYLSEAGDYFNGYSIRSINKSYCLDKYGKPDYHWSSNITSIGFDLLNEIKST